MAEQTVRMASAADAEMVAGMQIDFNDEFSSPCPTMDELVPRFRRIMGGEHGFVVVSDNAQGAIGYALITLRPTIYDDGPLAVLDELYVRPALRDQRIGTAILRRVIDEVRERGGGEIHINVDEPDTDTRRFYERHGFVNVQPGTEDRMLCYLQEL
ncbi:GNAT family N-acetyltransferase [Microbacterium sp.]|uniref:GNAT family N-acetyltransferase n=1 Tax=Microbacterium sp. TaxID=51671 RepID=UPI003F9A10D5